MTAKTYYSLDPDDQVHAKRLGEDLNLIRFVFAHHPELMVRTKEERKKTGGDNPHGRIFNGNPFTEEQLRTWADWANTVIIKGTEAIALQHPAYREGHRMALSRFRENVDEFLYLFETTRVS